MGEPFADFHRALLARVAGAYGLAWADYCETGEWIAPRPGWIDPVREPDLLQGAYAVCRLAWRAEFRAWMTLPVAERVTEAGR